MCVFCAVLPATTILGTTLRFAPPDSPPAPGAGGLLAPGRRVLGGLPPLALGIGLLLVGLAVFGPGSLQYKFDVLGFGVCHQLLSHSLIIGGHPLPVCARCTGIYLGTVVTWLLLSLLRPRAGSLPIARMTPLLVVMFLVMVADGVNSTFQSLPGGHGLWETTNPLRLVTGMLAGVAMTFVLYPLAQGSLWRRDLVRPEPVLEMPYELFGYGAVLAVLGGVALSSDGDGAAGPVYWLLAILSLLGLVLMLGLANLLLASSVARRAGWITSWRAALVPLSLALLLAVAELLLLAYVRGSLAGVIAAAGPLPGDLPLAAGVR